MAGYPRIPYGLANFRRIRMERRLYVDKTRFLHALEQVDHAVLIRPRRFGKTCWVSVLEHYYDRTWAHEFDAVFGGTDIGRQPTEQRHRYVVLRFNFSAFKTALDGLEHHFEEYCQLRLRNALERNPDLFPATAVRRIRAPASVNGQLNELFAYASDHGIPLYALIDEYDNFANTVLAHHGEAAYQSFTHGGGFYRNFFATLKAGTEAGSGGLERLFITGVSPVTLDDVTSGFNIGGNISLRPEFNDLLGFTEEEVRGLLKLYRDHGVLDQDVDAALDVMREWYNGYRFARRAEGDLYNTDMVLYYLCESVPNRSMPDELIDTNVRIDYGKLRHLLVVGRQLNGNFDLLRHVIGDGRVDAQVQPSFPLERLSERENFLSLLYFFGLLSFRHVSADTPRLGIPNQTVRRLMYALSARCVARRGRVLRRRLRLLASGARHGLRGGLAAGAGTPARRDSAPDGDSRLRRRRKGGARLSRRPLQPARRVPDPHGARAEQGLRRPLPGAVRGPLPRRGVRLRDRGQVPEAARVPGRVGSG